jgi:signal transduction histidine kinase
MSLFPYTFYTYIPPYEMKISLNRKIIYSIVFLGIVVLAALNFISWIFLRSLQDDLISELKQQFLNTGRLSAQLIHGSELETIAPGDENTLMVRSYQQMLYDLKLNNDLENIVLLDLSGRLLVDYRLNFQIGDSLTTFPLNGVMLRSAVLGEMLEPLLLHIRNQYFLSAYIPVKNDLDVTVAVLAIDAPTQFFKTLQKFKSGAFYLGAGGLFILLLFSTIILVAMRRLFESEQKIREQERLAQLGQMAATVAHEIRNPLSIMKGTADVLVKKYHSTGDEMFSFIPEEIARLNRLVEDFLQFARRPKLKLRRESIGEVVSQTLRTMNDSRLEQRIDNNLPQIAIDPDGLRQVLLNIIRNALEAAGGRGKVQVAARLVSGRSSKIMIVVEDNGPGFAKQELNKVFDPFYSTKASGSGLGLAISRQLVEAMNGQIEIYSEIGKGTRVIISLPV